MKQAVVAEVTEVVANNLYAFSNKETIISSVFIYFAPFQEQKI